MFYYLLTIAILSCFDLKYGMRQFVNRRVHRSQPLGYFRSNVRSFNEQQNTNTGQEFICHCKCNNDNDENTDKCFDEQCQEVLNNCQTNQECQNALIKAQNGVCDTGDVDCGDSDIMCATGDDQCKKLWTDIADCYNNCHNPKYFVEKSGDHCFDNQCQPVLNNCQTNQDCQNALTKAQNGICDTGIDCGNANIMCSTGSDQCKKLWNNIVHCYNYCYHPGKSAINCVKNNCHNDYNHCLSNHECANALNYASNNNCNNDECGNPEFMCNSDNSCIPIWENLVICYSTYCDHNGSQSRNKLKIFPLKKRKEKEFIQNQKKSSILRNRQFYFEPCPPNIDKCVCYQHLLQTGAVPSNVVYDWIARDGC